MAQGLGFKGICGVGDETTWGTAVTVTQLDPFQNETLVRLYDQVANAALEGNVAQRPALQGMTTPGGTLTSQLRYTTSHLLTKAFFGTLDGLTGTYSFDTTTEGKAITIAIGKTVSAWNFSGCKVNGMTLRAAPDGVTVDWDLLAKDMARDTPNTSTTLAGLSNNDQLVLFTDMEVWIGDLANALTSADAIGVENLTLTVTRNLQADHDNTAKTPLEPLENDFATATLAFRIPRYSADTFIGWHENDTALQAIVKFVSGTKKKEFHLPELKLTAVRVPVGGPGLLGVEVEATLYRNVDNANMTSNALIELVEA